MTVGVKVDFYDSFHSFLPGDSSDCAGDANPSGLVVAVMWDKESCDLAAPVVIDKDSELASPAVADAAKAMAGPSQRSYMPEGGISYNPA
jgi:hypothetical protein